MGGAEGQEGEGVEEGRYALSSIARPCFDPRLLAFTGILALWASDEEGEKVLQYGAGGGRKAPRCTG